MCFRLTPHKLATVDVECMTNFSKELHRHEDGLSAVDKGLEEKLLSRQQFLGVVIVHLLTQSVI